MKWFLKLISDIHYDSKSEFYAGLYALEALFTGASPGYNGAALDSTGAAPDSTGAAPGSTGATPNSTGASPGCTGASPGSRAGVRLESPSWS